MKTKKCTHKSCATFELSFPLLKKIYIYSFRILETLNLSMFVNNSTDTKRGKKREKKSHKNPEKRTLSAAPFKPPIRRFAISD